MEKYFYSPVKVPYHINQKFGENRACVDIATGTKVITCDGNNPPSGYKSVYGPSGHLGLDIATYRGQELFAAREGYVDSIDTNPRTGLDVRIISNVGDRKYKYIYEHLLGYQHAVGAKVRTGELVAWADNTGYSSADHLHYEMQELINGKWIHIDPLSVTDMTISAQDILWIEDKIVWAREQIAILSERVAERLRQRAKR